MKKYVVTLLFAAIMLLVFAACSGNGDEPAYAGPDSLVVETDAFPCGQL